MKHYISVLTATILAVAITAGGMIALDQNIPNLRAQEIEIDSMAEDKADAVVMVVSNPGSLGESATDPRGLGTGFFIDENLIVTNHHVIENSKQLAVKGRKNSKFYDSEIIASDKFSDVAIIRIKDWKDYRETNGYSKLEFDSSRNLKLGTVVWSIGHPWGLTWSVSKGVVSSPSRRIDGNLNFMIQTDTKIYQGNSGGPLLDEQGKVIGINHKMLAQTGGSFGMAIPSDLAVRIIDNLKSTGMASWAVIGVRLGVSDDMKHVAIKDVSPGSAGDKVGLQVGDVLLRVYTKNTPVNGIDIIDADSILDEMAIINPGDDVRLSIVRDGKNFDVNVKPDPRTSADLTPASMPSSEP